MNFPIFKTKKRGNPPANGKKFDLTKPEQRQEYFQLKAGPEIKKLKKYLEKRTFIIYLLGKKNSGKGTYAKMFGEAIGPEKIFHFSVGDMIREVDEELKDKKKKEELVQFLKNNYRGWFSLKEIISVLESRSTNKLLPTELILSLVKREIAKHKRKALFIDGFPREMDQIAFTLFFKDLIDYREDPDIFVLIDVPEEAINERIKRRRVCPICHTSRNLTTLPSSLVGYDEKNKEFFLMCDNPECEHAKMVEKEGDENGIEPIKKRLILDEELIEKAFSLYGVPKILLRNSVPIKQAKANVDDYELTPEYFYHWNEKKKEVELTKKPWMIKDNQGIKSYSLMPPPVVLSLIFQLTDILDEL